MFILSLIFHMKMMMFLFGKATVNAVSWKSIMECYILLIMGLRLLSMILKKRFTWPCSTHSAFACLFLIDHTSTISINIFRSWVISFFDKCLTWVGLITPVVTHLSPLAIDEEYVISLDQTYSWHIDREDIGWYFPLHTPLAWLWCSWNGW